MEYMQVPVLRCMHIDITGKDKEQAAFLKMKSWVHASVAARELFQHRTLYSQKRLGYIYVCFHDNNGDVTFGRLAFSDYKKTDKVLTVQDIFGVTWAPENTPNSILEIGYEALYIAVHAAFSSITKGA